MPSPRLSNKLKASWNSASQNKNPLSLPIETSRERKINVVPNYNTYFQNKSTQTHRYLQPYWKYPLLVDRTCTWRFNKWQDVYFRTQPKTKTKIVRKCRKIWLYANNIGAAFKTRQSRMSWPMAMWARCLSALIIGLTSKHTFKFATTYFVNKLFSLKRLLIYLYANNTL